MRVLIGCEYSGTVRDAFTERGHDAMSCDLLPTESEGLHYQGDIFDLLTEGAEWDLIILHPPCTALTVAGNKWYGEGQPRYDERLAAAEWTEELWLQANKVSPRVCLENPVGVLNRLTCIPKATYVQPYEHGHLEQKKTGLHLHGLAPLQPTNNVYDEMMKLPKNKRERLHYLPPSPNRWKIRSTTFDGIAKAMAEQWG
jgi:hypothetical protein